MHRIFVTIVFTGAVALAHAMPGRVLGAIPLNPATPVFDDSVA